MHIVLVDMYIKPERREEYIKEIKTETEHALEMEHGMLQFHILTDTTDPDTLRLLEVFRDEAAARFHREQSYFKEFMNRTREWYAKPAMLRTHKNVEALGSRQALWTNV